MYNEKTKPIKGVTNKKNKLKVINALPIVKKNVELESPNDKKLIKATKRATEETNVTSAIFKAYFLIKNYPLNTIYY